MVQQEQAEADAAQAALGHAQQQLEAAIQGGDTAVIEALPRLLSRGS